LLIRKAKIDARAPLPPLASILPARPVGSPLRRAGPLFWASAVRHSGATMARKHQSSVVL